VIHIEGKAQDIGIVVGEIAAAVLVGLIVLVRCRGPHGAGTLARFYPDDRRSVVGEEFHGQRADHRPGVRQYLQAAEYAFPFIYLQSYDSPYTS
jgi:hypothetical protein